MLTWDLVWTPWSSRPKSLLDFGNGAKGLDELHWDDVGLSRRRGGCLLGWCRSIGDLLLGSSYSDGVLNLDWSKFSLTVPSASSWTKSKSGFWARFWIWRGKFSFSRVQSKGKVTSVNFRVLGT